MKLLLRWLISAVALLIIANYIPGIKIIGVYPALVAALILGLINALIRPLAVVLTLPITIITLGLFTLVINGLMFWFASTIVKGFYVSGFMPAFWGALIMSLVGWGTNMMLKKTY
ncbi:phage holin family protein [Patescibacteria group bacterium]|nr:phage holin family protein [Patescibacteria group bacterium]MBU1612874.1 phage holin family protein [Patescibacteria group bacterium]